MILNALGFGIIGGLACALAPALVLALVLGFRGKRPYRASVPLENKNPELCGNTKMAYCGKKPPGKKKKCPIVKCLTLQCLRAMFITLVLVIACLSLLCLSTCACWHFDACQRVPVTQVVLVNACLSLRWLRFGGKSCTVNFSLPGPDTFGCLDSELGTGSGSNSGRGFGFGSSSGLGLWLWRLEAKNCTSQPSRRQTTSQQGSEPLRISINH